MNTLIDSFIEYVAAQDRDKKIDHDHGWCNCAVGDWACVRIAGRSLSRDEREHDFVHLTREYDPLLAELQEHFPELYSELNNPTYGGAPSFYGELADLLAEREC